MKPKLKPIADQILVITGASSGIGLATAKMAVAKGARVVLAARSQAALDDVTCNLNHDGLRAVCVNADVTSEKDVERIAAQAIETFGGFDTWVNNAGVTIFGKLLDVPVEDQKRLFETNYWGVVYGSLTAARHLQLRGGAIINVGSTLSDQAIPIQGGYSASKHAVKGFTEALRMELEEDGAPISVTLVKPSAINTPYTEHGKNYLRVEPKPPAPVYAPELVAEAILHCAEHPVRDIFVGGAGKALSVANKYAPRLVDKVMETFASDSQRSNRLASTSPENGLDSPSGDGRVAGDYKGHVRRSSLYTKSVIHPVIAGGFLLAGLGLAYAVAKSRLNFTD